MTTSFDSADTRATCIHSYQKCKNRTCSTLSSQEVSRLNKESVDRFQRPWIMDDSLTYPSSTSVNWLIIPRYSGRECSVYSAKNMAHYITKTKARSVALNQQFRFKQKPVEDHANSQQHAAAVTAELLSRVSMFEEEVRKIQDTRDKVYYKTLPAKYWIAKEEIPKKKFMSLLVVPQQLGLEDNY